MQRSGAAPVLQQALTGARALGKLGLRPRLKPGFSHPDVRRVAKLMLPTLFSSSVAQLNLLVGTVFALVRFIDIPIDTAMGLAMDRT